MIDHIYTSIPGNFTFEKLYTYLATIGHGRGVEIGVGSGRSAAYLAVELLRAHASPVLTLVDNSLGNLELARAAVDRVFAQTPPVDPNPALYVNHGVSWEVAEHYLDGSQDFVFIDGDHTYDAVRKDITAWLPKVRKGGVIAGHDYVEADWSGVIDAVNEAFPRYEVWRGSKWTDGKYYPSWLVRVD